MLLQIVEHDLEEDLVQKMVEDGFKGGFKWSFSFEDDPGESQVGSYLIKAIFNLLKYRLHFPFTHHTQQEHQKQTGTNVCFIKSNTRQLRNRKKIITSISE